MEFETGTVCGNWSHCLAIFNDFTVAFDERFNTAFQTVHGIFCGGVCWDEDDTHAWVSIRAIDLLHCPSVCVISNAEDTGPLEWSVAVAVVVVGVSASHFENGHCEIFRVFCVEFKDILAFFEMEDGNHRVSWAARWISDGFLSLNVSVTFVSSIVVVMIIVAVFVMVVMVVVTVFVMIIFAVVIVVFFMEFHVECGVLGMNFNVISVLFFISEFDVFVRAFGECFTQVRNKHAFVIKSVLASWHGVDFDGGRCICTEGREG